MVSHSSSATIASTTQPLSDILPWGPTISVSSDHSPNNPPSVSTECRTLLVTDACSTDGRFMLHTLALQFLSSRYSSSPSGNDMMEGAVLWISCAPVSEKQIMMGLRKGLQHNLGGGHTTGAASSWTGGKGGSSSSASFGQQGGVGNSSGRIHIVSMPLDLADAALDQENGESFSHEVYLKQVHKRIVHWLNNRELMHMHPTPQQRSPHEKSCTLGPNLIIIDNATALGTLFGDRLASAFLSSVRSSLRKYSKKASQSKENAARSNETNGPAVTTINLLTIRASSPDDGGLYQIDGDGSMKGEKLRSEYSRLLRPWLGFGSGMSTIGSNEDGAGTNILQMEEQSNYFSLPPHSVPSFLYRSGLYEAADGIVDVSPLESGYARDVLGRLSFATTWGGKGWWGIASHSAGGTNMGAAGRSGVGNAVKKEEINGAYASICVNYRCDDSGVRVMRLRSR
ncbi:hypothetical protein ACHAXR_011232 [Thalassiosira sp. AJA248-18]